MYAAIWSAIGILAAGLLGTIFSFNAPLDAGFARLEARLDEGFARIDQRFGQIDLRLDQVNFRIDGLSARLDSHISPPNAG
jgi:hypothetical protein